MPGSGRREKLDFSTEIVSATTPWLFENLLHNCLETGSKINVPIRAVLELIDSAIPLSPIYFGSIYSFLRGGSEWLP